MRWVVRYVAGLPCTTLWKGGAAGRRQLEPEGGGGNDELDIFAVAFFDCLEACC